MESENTKSEAQELDLGESIDALLGEIDVSCASFEKQPDSPADASGLISDDGTMPDISDQIAEKSAGGTGAESLPADSDENDDADDATEESVEESSGADSVGEDALEALEAVSQSAEALLEESIGELLDGVKEAGGADAQDDAQGEVETAHALAEESVSEKAVEEAVVEEADETEAAEEIGESEPDGEDAEGLLDSINEELLSSLEDEQIEAVHAIDDAQPVDETLDEDQQVEETDQVVEETPDQDTSDDAHDEVEDSIAKETATEETTAEAQAVEEDDADEPELDAESDDQLGNLDDALAGLGDELLMGDFEDADGEMVEADESQGSMDPALLLDQLDLSDKQQADDEPEPVGETDVETSGVEASNDQAMATQEADGKPVAEQVQSATQDAPVSVARVPEAIMESAAGDETTQQSQTDADTQIESIWQTLLRVGRNRGVGLVSVVRTQMGPISAKGVLLLSKPIAEKPASVRNSVGYIAIWTLFLAMVLWIYVMFFRSSEPVVPTKAPTRVVMPGEDLEPIEHQMATQPAMP